MVIDFLDIHTHKSSQDLGTTSIQSLSLTNDIFLAMPKKKFISIGLHPWYATLNQLDVKMTDLKVLAKQANVKLIGECGLDKLRGEKIANQLIILQQQILLADELHKPVILHCVKAFDELIVLKNKISVKVPLIIHGFNKSEELGKQLIAHGFLLSFGKSVLEEESSASKLVKSATFFFLETDDAENNLEEIYHAVAAIKKCSVNELKALIFANWKKVGLL